MTVQNAASAWPLHRLFAGSVAFACPNLVQTTALIQPFDQSDWAKLPRTRVKQIYQNGYSLNLLPGYSSDFLNCHRCRSTIGR